ncbi:dinuclear metal center protein, YbgI/SA1388 family [Frankia sp. EI5c]|uniref:Nif3-like dinuclear metal center hexameric protein n=1 Tax=Frankia sp. EI5c TaxID=683316 RepID=UPI0007C20CF2|nr:Nif3-like dinuclear metal center hexameric protein [Frankia sp. EI5c]OAA28629.1 dinuclear metal center protein, YbgI/SA1388 family [Frankia sp. EI5c]
MTSVGATVRDCVSALESCYPPAWAEPWDAVGLSVGDPEAPVREVLFAVDPTPAVAAEAAGRAQLLVTHHPLFLRGVHTVAETTTAGRVAATLIRAGVTLFTVHTNADVAEPGVSDALAASIGLRDVQPLDRAATRAEGRVRTRTGAGTECRGLGRIGLLPAPEPLAVFCQRVARALPVTAGGVRATGTPGMLVRRVAVCGGAGGELAGAAAAAGADVLVTADGRHHHTLDAVADHGLVIVDVAHWASEWPWLAGAADRLRAGLAARGRTVNTLVSTLVTDPWRLHMSATGTGPAVGSDNESDNELNIEPAQADQSSIPLHAPAARSEEGF